MRLLAWIHLSRVSAVMVPGSSWGQHRSEWGNLNLPVSRVSPASPGHVVGLRPRSGVAPAGTQRCGTCGRWLGLSGRATLRLHPPCWPHCALCRTSTLYHPACPLCVPCAPWCHAGAVPRGDSIVRACPRPVTSATFRCPLGALAGLGPFPWQLPKLSALCWWQLPGETGSPVPVCTCVHLSGDSCRVAMPVLWVTSMSQPPRYGDVPMAVPTPGWHQTSVSTRGSQPRRGDTAKRCRPRSAPNPPQPRRRPRCIPQDARAL